MLEVTEIKRIYNPKGDIYHALKSSEGTFTGFGEAYFTSILPGEIKGWKKHSKMVLNLIVPLGDVTFYIYDDEKLDMRHLRVNEDNYVRLTIYPGYWVAFEGHGAVNLILNIASIEHDPNEAVNLPLEAFSLGGSK